MYCKYRLICCNEYGKLFHTFVGICDVTDAIDGLCNTMLYDVISKDGTLVVIIPYMPAAIAIYDKVTL